MTIKNYDKIVKDVIASVTEREQNELLKSFKDNNMSDMGFYNDNAEATLKTRYKQMVAKPSPQEGRILKVFDWMAAANIIRKNRKGLYYAGLLKDYKNNNTCIYTGGAPQNPIYDGILLASYTDTPILVDENSNYTECYVEISEFDAKELSTYTKWPDKMVELVQAGTDAPLQNATAQNEKTHAYVKTHSDNIMPEIKTEMPIVNGRQTFADDGYWHLLNNQNN